VYKFTPPKTINMPDDIEGIETKDSYYLLIEFATPLRSLRRMYEGGLAQLDENAMRLERNKFRQVTEDILNYKEMNACRGKCLVVDFYDEDLVTTASVREKETLSQAVWRALVEDMRMEKYERRSDM